MPCLIILSKCQDLCLFGVIQRRASCSWYWLPTLGSEKWP